MVILRRRILAELSRIVRCEWVFVEIEMANKLIDRDEDIQQAAQAIKAIAHPLRLKILCVLGDQEISVQDIVDQVGTSQSNISQHLAILRDKGVLATRKDSNRVYYRIGDLRTLKLVGMMRDVFCVV
jgi:ArsR family transcriptional regulator